MTKPYLVITGGSRGIGLATAKRYADAGYGVINLSRSAIDLDGATQLNVDLSDASWPEQAGGWLQELLSGASHIVAVHNSGVLYKDSVADVSATAMHTALQVNLVAASQLNQLLLPLMKPGSAILYVSSTLGEKAVPNTCSYVVSKHALIGLMRSTVQDLAGQGIHSACICPGFTDTEMLREHLGNNEEIFDSIKGEITFGRLLEPEEIAETLWFAGNNPAINGAILHANLGQVEH